jgi:sugar lactone lactonase YvrE
MFRNATLVAIAAAAIIWVANATAQVITTFAGRGPYSKVGALSVPLPPVWPITISKTTGSVYFSAALTVYRYDPTPGTITPVAGNGTSGSSGDGGPATSAQIEGAAGLALDGFGNLYIADNHGNRIRKVTPAGTISTVAGNGVAGYSGDGGPATKASLNFPFFVAVNPTNGALYIADYGNGLVREVIDGDISSVSQTAGSYPLALTVDPRGNLYYINDSQSAPRYVDILQKLVPGGEPTTIANLNNTGCEEGLVIDSNDDLYTTDYCLSHVYQISNAGKVSIIAGSSASGYSPDGTPALAAALSEPSDVTVDAAGNVYFTDWGNRRVRKFKLGGTLTTLAGNGNGDGGLATAVPLYNLRTGVAVDHDGRVLMGDLYSVRRIDSSGTMETIAGTTATGFSGDGGPATQASLGFVGGIAILPTVGASSNGYLLADPVDERIRYVDPQGDISTVAGNGTQGYGGDGGSALAAPLLQPNSIAAGPSGEFFVGGFCEGGFDCVPSTPTPTPHDESVIRKVSESGIISLYAGNHISGYGGDGGPATDASLNHPLSFTTDSFGNLYIADTYNQRIRKVDTAGTITTVAGDGIAGFRGDGGKATSAELNLPQDVAVDATGTVYLSDHRNNRIRKVTAGGIISTVAGTGTAGFSGDGGPAVDAKLNGPMKIALDPTGSVLYVMDSGNSRVRRIAGLLGDTTASVSPTAIAFGDEPIGVASKTKTVTLKNTGTKPLSLYAVTLSGTGVASFSNSNDCEAAVAAASTCTINVTFLPGTPGAATAMLSIRGNVAPSLASIDLSGTGTPDTTTTTLVATPSSGAVGTTITLKATVVPVAGTLVPTGTVTFKNGATTLGSSPLSAAGAASLEVSTLAAGAHSITAVYAGDVDDEPSTSSDVIVTIK